MGDSKITATVICALGKEYALQLFQVVEFVEMAELIRPPKAPAYLQGLLCLRGAMVPVVDLAHFLNLPQRDNQNNTLAVVEMAGGLLAFPCENVRPPVRGNLMGDKVISPLFQRDEEFFPLLNLNDLITEEERDELEALRQLS